MARLTHIIRDIIFTAFETGQASDLLQEWRDAFAQVLIADLGQPERTPILPTWSPKLWPMVSFRRG